MDQLHLMTVFAAVAEAESFAGGARKLKLSPPAATRAIAALERRLGVKLFTRTTRFVRATDAGVRYLERARRIIADVSEADDAAAGVHAEPRGHLAVTAPELFGRIFVMPSVVEYLRRHAGMSVSALFVDRVVNLLEEGIDVSVRIGELPDSSMHATGVGHVRRVVCAAPGYLRAHGTPRAPADLAGHAIISASAVSPSGEWRFSDGKKTIGVRVNPRLTVTSNDAAIHAALQGFGVTRLLSYQVAAHLESDRLQVVLRTYEPPRLPIHVLHLEGRQASAKVRTFFELLVERLRAERALH